MVKYTGLSKAEALTALYNASKFQGMGFFQFMNDAPSKITVEQAENLLKNGTRFDYLYGKVMKIDLSAEDEFEEWLYDRDNGQGTAKKAIDDALNNKKDSGNGQDENLFGNN